MGPPPEELANPISSLSRFVLLLLLLLDSVSGISQKTVFHTANLSLARYRLCFQLSKSSQVSLKQKLSLYVFKNGWVYLYLELWIATEFKVELSLNQSKTRLRYHVSEIEAFSL